MEATERAVTRLTQAHTEMTEAGPTEWPPLLVWLEEAITTVVGRGGAGSGGAGIPLNTEAIDLLAYIDGRLSLLMEALNLRRRNARRDEVTRVWRAAKDERAGGRVGDAQWESMCDEFQDWVMRIQAQDDRPRKMELTVPCPRCDTRWVADKDGNQSAAVAIEFRPGHAPVAECRNGECQAMWAGWAAVTQLGFTIGAQQDLAVLAACGIDMERIITTV